MLTILYCKYIDLDSSRSAVYLYDVFSFAQVCYDVKDRDVTIKGGLTSPV